MKQKNNITNEDKYNIAKKKIFLWYMIIVFGILTIVLSIISLVFKISPIYAIICFVLEIIFSKLYEKLKGNK